MRLKGKMFIYVTSVSVNNLVNEGNETRLLSRSRSIHRNFGCTDLGKGYRRISVNNGLLINSYPSQSLDFLLDQNMS